MKIFTYLIRSASGVLLIAGAAASLFGALNAALIALVHWAVSNPNAIGATQALAFGALVLGRVGASYLAEMTLIRHSERSIAELRRSLINRLLAVPFRHFELVGSARVFASLTDDVAAVNGALFSLPGFAVSVAMLAGGAAYMMYLSWQALLWLVVLALAGMFAHRAASRNASRFFERARDEHDRLFGLFRALTDGAKELKLNRRRRSAFVEGEVARTTESLMQNNIAAHSRYFAARVTGSMFFFLLVGLLVFLLPAWQSQSSQVLSGYVLTALFLMGPFNNTVRIAPTFSIGSIALDRIERLGLSLSEEPAETPCPADLPSSWKSLQLRSATLTYSSEDGEPPFTLGPIDLSIMPGELLFVTGGNGSGKSTLAKLLTGLYQPEEGELLWDGEPVTDSNRDAYRQLFSAVFSDFFLFDSLLGLEGPDLDQRATQQLKWLRLGHKVKVAGGSFSSTDLSQGQRKRLALLTALLEDRPLYLFDEWAADQDPDFKNVFYKELIPSLVERGKTVIVITHDDRYFHLAHRLLAMEEGRLK